MGLSLFLAKFFGIYFLIVAGLWLARKDQFEKLAGDIFRSEALLGLSGILSLIFGIAIVVGHPVWVMGWPVIITLIGYLGIFQGIMRIGFPKECQAMAEKFMHNTWIPLGIIFVLGLFLTYFGFFE